MAEEWRAIAGYEGLYEVSDQGCVRSLDRTVLTFSRWGDYYTKHLQGRVLRQGVAEHGRPRVALSCEGKVTGHKVCRLVALTFLPRITEKNHVDHIDGNPANNMLGNLRWVDAAGNMRNKHKTSGASGEIGVDWRHHCVNKPWRAQGTDRRGRPTHLGYFATKEEAAAVYRQFRAENF